MLLTVRKNKVKHCPHQDTAGTACRCDDHHFNPLLPLVRNKTCAPTPPLKHLSVRAHVVGMATGSPVRCWLQCDGPSLTRVCGVCGLVLRVAVSAVCVQLSGTREEVIRVSGLNLQQDPLQTGRRFCPNTHVQRQNKSRNDRIRPGASE